jgi:chorismate mutase
MDEIRLIGGSYMYPSKVQELSRIAIDSLLKAIKIGFEVSLLQVEEIDTYVETISEAVDKAISAVKEIKAGFDEIHAVGEVSPKVEGFILDQSDMLKELVDLATERLRMSEQVGKRFGIDTGDFRMLAESISILARQTIDILYSAYYSMKSVYIEEYSPESQSASS